MGLCGTACATLGGVLCCILVLTEGEPTENALVAAVCCFELADKLGISFNGTAIRNTLPHSYVGRRKKEKILPL